MRANWRLIAVTLTAAMSLAASPARAQWVDVTYSGKITSVTPHAPISGLAIGDTFTGGFRYNLNALNSDGRPNFGFYQNANEQFFVDFGPGKGGLFSQSGPQTYNNVQVANNSTDYGAQPFDGLYAYGNMQVAGYSYVESGISLQSLLNPLSTNGLPQAGIDWSKFLAPAGGVYADNPSLLMGAGMEFHAVFGDGCGPDQGFADDCAASAYGEITAISATSVVPEPSTILLMASGLGALAMVGVRRRRATTQVDK